MRFSNHDLDLIYSSHGSPNKDVVYDRFCGRSQEINGYLVKPFDLKNFYNGICFCYKNLEKLQLNSLKISKKWSPEKISKQYLKLFNGL